jgi:DNA-binding PadR family transcriptional regulator
VEHDARTILQLIEGHSGEWTWYQLSRYEGTGFVVAGELMNLIRSLKASGYITEIEGPNPNQPIYVITDLGREAIADGKNNSPTP